MSDEFWAGDFGDAYHERQGKVGNVASNCIFFDKILSGRIKNIASILEIGAGVGRNIEALHYLYRDIKCKAVEINLKAAAQIEHAEVSVKSIYDNTLKADLVLTKGLLIHIPPENISEAYEVIYKSAKKYILMCEYFNPRREGIDYRGNSGKLWKADFYGEIIAQHPDLKLIDYGFVGSWDESPQDNLTWWLLEKI